MNSNTIVSKLQKHQNPDNVKGMSRFGINTQNAIGILLPYLRSLAIKIGKNHNLAIDLWKTKVHEARILATLIDYHKLVTEKQMNEKVFYR